MKPGSSLYQSGEEEEEEHCRPNVRPPVTGCFIRMAEVMTWHLDK